MGAHERSGTLVVEHRSRDGVGRWPAVVVVGFGTAVGMWITGFITHLPALRMAPVSVALLLLLIQAIGGWWAGRSCPRRDAALIGGLGGLVTACVNLLILGALLAEDHQTNSLRPGWAMLLAGYFSFSSALGALTAYAASAGGSGAAARPARDWLGTCSIVAAAAGVPVILSGGLVTSTGAGLAVPDWPTSYSANMFLYPLSRMTGGIYYEHAHRLFGSLVGITTLALTLFTLRVETRGWVKWLVIGVFLLVCAQGVLGGARVIAATPIDTAPLAATSDNALSRPLAMIHGMSGQVTFALLCVSACVLSSRWRAGERRGGIHDGALRTLSAALLLILLAQLGLGAATRHFQHLHAAFAHAGFAVFALIAASMAGFRAARHAGTALRRLGTGVTHTAWLQTVLGLVTLFLVLPYDGSAKSPAAVVLATAHQANGALVLGLSAALWAWGLRLTSPGARPDQVSPAL